MKMGTPLAKLQKGVPFEVVERQCIGVGAMGTNKVWGRCEEFRGLILTGGTTSLEVLSGWVDLTTYKCDKYTPPNSSRLSLHMRSSRGGVMLSRPHEPSSSAESLLRVIPSGQNTKPLQLGAATLAHHLWLKDKFTDAPFSIGTFRPLLDSNYFAICGTVRVRASIYTWTEPTTFSFV